MKKNDQICWYCDPTTISSSVKKNQCFIFQRNLNFGKNATSFVINPSGLRWKLKYLDF